MSVTGDNFYLLVMVRGADSNLSMKYFMVSYKTSHSMNNFLTRVEILACIDR